MSEKQGEYNAGELKRCPYCGTPGDPQFRTSAFCPNEECPNNNRDFQGACFMTVDEYNTRPLEDAQAARIAALEKQVAALVGALGRISTKSAIEGLVSSDPTARWMFEIAEIASAAIAQAEAVNEG